MAKFYSKEKVIGSGTFGSVWLVKSKTSNHFFVLKEVNLASMNATESRQAVTEVTILSRCRHRNIIQYKDAVIDHKTGMLSIIMEYADGGDLYSAIIKQGGMPFKEHTVITWFTHICLALQYIHHKNILHRDLKTRNIFLTRDKQIKIGDFGIARCLTETTDFATTAIGTPYYLSPEICQRKPYNHKSDIWALGCILFEMAALAHPFQASSFAHLLSLILSGKRRALPEHCSSLVKDLVAWLLNDNAEERPSADEILAIPCLQPYLSELWVTQNNSCCTSSTKMLNQKVCSRRHSSADSAKKTNELQIRRRASISSVDSKASKSRFGFVSRTKSVPGQKVTTSSRPRSLKEPKTSTMKSSARTGQFSTYKVLNPTLFKRTKISMNSSKLPHQKNVLCKWIDGKYSKRNESDSGYQRENLNYISGKLSDVEISIKTSTKKCIHSPNFEIAQSVINDDVFDNCADQKDVDSSSSAKANHAYSECCHSQCQQCMLDMLWKNRIRGTIGPLVQSDERAELIRKLHAVFGVDLFDDVYHAMISNWESSESGHIPKSLSHITNSLNYGQLQHLPLMMQLIQLDLVPK